MTLGNFSNPSMRFVKTQQEMAELYKPSPFTEEDMDHPICEVGFMEGDPLVRMSDRVFVQAVGTILKSRPSARLWDITPVVPYKEVKLAIQDIRAYKMSFEEKTFFLMEEFVRRPRMAGFKIEWHNVGSNTGELVGGLPPSLSISVYEVEEDLGDSCVPVKIHVRYRTLF